MFLTIFTGVIAIYFLTSGIMALATGKIAGNGKAEKKYTVKSIREFAHINGVSYIMLGISEAIITTLRLSLGENSDAEVIMETIFLIPIVAAIIITLGSRKKLVKKK